MTEQELPEESERSLLKLSSMEGYTKGYEPLGGGPNIIRWGTVRESAPESAEAYVDGQSMEIKGSSTVYAVQYYKRVVPPKA